MFEIDKQKDFFVGIDSDGCAFDTMEIKHKECFIPNTIKYYALQAISKYAREAAEFVNLYSKSRGINRFPALTETLEWLQKRPEVKARDFKIEIPASLDKWIKEETKLGNPALEKLLETVDDPDLKLALEWSLKVNETVADMVSNVPPFPLVRESLEKLYGKADMLVCSATPNEALKAEWGEHGLIPCEPGLAGRALDVKVRRLGGGEWCAGLRGAEEETRLEVAVGSIGPGFGLGLG